MSENPFYIRSFFLKETEPLLIKYYDFDCSMLIDEIKDCVENSDTNYIIFENGIPTTNYQKTFYRNNSWKLAPIFNSKKNISDEYPEYFDFEGDDDEKRKKKYYEDY